ncbi:MarR family winged helix-turn-helix transcriptional regulator [Streptomyces aidingensis]|uniref:DNA-binding transcriptional regulator, MarR family n=1 Tax=Streptomyces aidingensis TaxID=910347 RepID=A0A1I1Q0A8_9ACTN|nr:MarR family transcriptional regulator [Streptomyces aidingensis]SFD15591.1 DNA-binding transcriptional regulator, MarR family [Streptomyces aidingensis]
MTTTAQDATGDARRQELFRGTVLAASRLDGQLLAAAGELARPAGLTAAWWQVLDAVLPGPLPVAGIARAMGVSRQSVQRVADLLVSHGWAAYCTNPAHRRAKLLAPTAEGRAAVARIGPGQAAFAARLSAAMGGEAELAAALGALRRLSAALEAVHAADTGKPLEPGA